jgi:hypothetical protein
MTGALPRLYPGAAGRLLFPDDSTELLDFSRIQLCIHTMDGFLYGSEEQWRTNGPDGIRSHFGIGGPADAKTADGLVLQWAPLTHRAYAQNGGNPYCISVETSDGAQSPTPPWSDAQITALVDLIVWFTHHTGMRTPQLAIEPGEYGTITYHQQFDIFNTHSHDCPGTARRTQLVNRVIPAAQQRFTNSQGDDIMPITDADAATIWGHDVQSGDAVVKAYAALSSANSAAAGALAAARAANTKLDTILAEMKAGAPVDPAAVAEHLDYDRLAAAIAAHVQLKAI